MADTPEEQEEIYQLMTEDGLTSEIMAGPCHRTLAGAIERLKRRVKEQGGTLIPPAPTGDRPWATRCGANKSTVWIENRNLGD